MILGGRNQMILATGAGGMMGSYLPDFYSEKELIRTNRHALNICDYQQVLSAVERLKPTRVIHLAAETDVDLCEKQVDHAYKANVLGTMNVALACQKFDIEMVYISTAGVFDGTKWEPYTEFDQPAPVSVYAKTKWEGEKIVQNLLRRYYIIRAGWMLGGKEKDKKFVGKILSLCETRDEISVVNDKYGNPTYAKDMIYNLKLLTESGFYGLYHMVNEGWGSRYEIAQEIVNFLGKRTKLVPVPSSFFPLPAPRPRSEVLQNYKLELLGLNHMRQWKEALHDYLSTECHELAASIKAASA
jgi:dTDP-4-dehydrorhamnose reductase